MARIGRFVVPGLPHHVTQRGNRRERVFFSDADYELYRDLLHEACSRKSVAVWSYCLLPNHVHLILTPATPEGLGRALGRGHRRYSTFVNARNRVTGHLFQGRFSSVVMDEEHLMAAARFVGDESGQGGARRARRGLAVVERAGASGRPRRRAGRGRPAPVPLRRTVRRSDRGRAGPGAHRLAARRGDDRPPSGSPAVSGPARRAGRARSAAAKAGPQASGRGGRCGQGFDVPGDPSLHKSSIMHVSPISLCMCHRYPRYPPISPDIPSSLRERKRSDPENVRALRSLDCRNGCEKVTV